MKRIKCKKGFTIVELVIVIVVIGILASVLVPVFMGAVEKAKYSRQLQQAKNMMTEDLVFVDGDFKLLDKSNLLNLGLTYYYKSTIDIIEIDKNAEAGKYYDLNPKGGSDEHGIVTQQSINSIGDNETRKVYRITSNSVKPHGIFDITNNTYKITITEDNVEYNFMYDNNIGVWSVE